MGKSTITGTCSIAMLNYQRVLSGRLCYHHLAMIPTLGYVDARHHARCPESKKFGLRDALYAVILFM
jgi:hypothetical protein